MKVRTGFVSNSSSSSFVLKPDEAEFIKDKHSHVDIYEIQKIIDLFETIIFKVPSEKDCEGIMPWHIYNKELGQFEENGPFYYTTEELKELLEKGYTHITEELEYGYLPYKLKEF